MGVFDVSDRLPREPGKKARSLREYQWKDAWPFALIHVLAVYGLFLDVSWQVWTLCGVLYVVRMFGTTGWYHRYFAHRTFKTSRWFQFLMAFLAQTSCQRGVLWWAAHHRDHHKYSDSEKDLHSPVQHGFWYSHMGWIYDHNDVTKYARIKDFARYPELVLLDKYWLAPPTILGVACYLWGGLPGLLVGFMFSTVLLWHGTFTINSLSHVWGRRAYDTTDASRNYWLLAIITLGEGWHNNHHHYMNCTRQGFHWWQIDITYYVLKAMSWVGLVWDLKEPPAHIVAGVSRRPKTPEAKPDAHAA
jgi:stearoyl-CoA desaturase (delta-9 desaturase)